MSRMVLENYPKVLVISHNSFNLNKNNGKTLSSIFYGWNPNQIAQIFFAPEAPDTNICFKYYRITDSDIIASIFNKKVICGGPLSQKKPIIIKQPKQEGKLFNFFRGIKWPIVSIMRDIIWSTKKWNTLELQNWINAFSPEVVFFVGSNNTFSYDFTLSIVKKNKIPLVLYLTDDYVSSNLIIDPFWWIHFMRIKKRFLIAKNIAKKIFVIGDLMAEEYSRKFGGNFQPLMNIVEIPRKIITPLNKLNKIFEITYLGSICGLNRWKSLHEIGLAVGRLRSEGVRVRLTIYSMDNLTKRIKKAIHRPPSMIFAGPIFDNRKLQSTLIESDLVIHAESFKRKFKHITRLSISTKISEYLSYGKCIFAYGPKEVASILYLEKNEAAIICTKEEDIYSSLKNIIFDLKKQSQLREKALLLAKQKHVRPNMKLILNNVIHDKN